MFSHVPYRLLGLVLWDPPPAWLLIALRALFVVGLLFSLVSLVLIFRGSVIRGWLGAMIPWISLPCCIIALSILVSLQPPVARVREASPRGYTTERMKQLGMAMHNYAGAHRNRFPPAAIHSKEGKPLLSWRVLLLPYVEGEEVYRELHLDEPWDSPHNLALLPRMPATYAPPPGLDLDVEPYTTFFQVFVGKETAFQGKDGLRFREDFSNGLANTILVVEAGKAVPWTKPEDMVYEEKGPLPALGGLFMTRDKGWHALFGDGVVRFIGADVSEGMIRDAITGRGSQVFGSE